jgi:DNA invertase Pin-like site-specific DNA recombinase
MIYGYARVSTGGQSEATQVLQLRAAGAGMVFREVASGAKTDRPQLHRLLAETAHGCLMLTALGGLAEFERELIRARTGEGRERAKSRGQSLGRPFKLTPHQRSEAIHRRDRGEPLSEIGCRIDQGASGAVYPCPSSYTSMAGAS